MNKEILFKEVEGGIVLPAGFKCAYTAAGIKYEGRDDMALLYCEVPATTAATFTKNVVKASPVIWDRDHVKNFDTARAVLINSGIANAACGPEGMNICETSAKHLADCLDIKTDDVLVASTGVIGMLMPVDKLNAGSDVLAKNLSGEADVAHGAARAIMTTDTRPKEIAIEFQIGDKNVHIAAMAKGSGMIHPDMCTMLSFVTTDVDISKELLQKALSDVVDESYNMISVDGDTSTNDTVLIMASGLAGNEKIVSEDDNYKAFVEALRYVNIFIAKSIAADGEGATGLLEVVVNGAKTLEDARVLSKSVVSSSLTKAAVFGNDANWGRIICALGYSGVDFDPENVDIYIASSDKTLQLVHKGVACDYSEEEATKLMDSEKLTIECDMHSGDKSATAWGCDLSYDYVKINADYRS